MAEIKLQDVEFMESELKTKKIRMREAPDPVGVSYEKLLRRHDRTKKVYPVDPYVEVYQFRDNLYCQGW